MTQKKAQARDVHKLMHECAHEFHDLEIATDAWLVELTAQERIALVRPYARVLMRNYMRGQVRRLESETFSPGGSIILGDLSQLLAERVCLPDGRWVTWGAMSVDEHLLRAQWQEELAGACVLDAERHRAAADVITERGVSCLDDVS